MDIELQKPTFNNPPEDFAGDVWLDVIATPHIDVQAADDPATSTIWLERITDAD